MTLSDLAKIYDEQLLSRIYFIISRTQKRVYMLNSDKRNFMHLTGLQRSEEFKNFKPKKDFFDLCLHDGRETNSLTFTSKADRNIALLKINAFEYCYKAIHNLDSVYISENTITCASRFTYGGKEKLFSISFSEESANIWRPVTIQVDKNLESSKIIDPTDLTDVCDIVDMDKESAIKSIAKYSKTILDVRSFVINKYGPDFK